MKLCQEYQENIIFWLSIINWGHHPHFSISWARFNRKIGAATWATKGLGPSKPNQKVGLLCFHNFMARTPFQLCMVLHKTLVKYTPIYRAPRLTEIISFHSKGPANRGYMYCTKYYDIVVLIFVNKKIQRPYRGPLWVFQLIRIKQ